MTILQASLTNIYRSLDDYLTVNLVDANGAPVSIRHHGQRRFIPPADAPWIEAHYDLVALDSRFLNLAGPRVAGSRPEPVATERRGALQLNLFQRARAFATRYTTAAMRDLVLDAFPEGGLIPIYDWAEFNVTGEVVHEGDIVMDGVTEHVLDTGGQSGVIQHVVEVRTRYWEIVTRA